MPKIITLDKLKTESFNSVAAVEEMVDLDLCDLERSLKQIQESIAELEGLREALFFKAEKLKRDSALRENKRCVTAVATIEKQLKELEIPPLGNTFVLLEKNKEILELKAVQKYLRYFIELDKKGSQVLKTLLNSEIKGDWIFLAELLYYAIHCKEMDDKSQLFECSKKLEAKLVGVFRKSLKEEALSECYTAFQALVCLEKETLLLDEYIFQSGFFNIDLEIEHVLSDNIDIDNPSGDNNKFSMFMQRLIDLIESSSPQFASIFGNETRYNIYFYNVIFKMVIFRVIERFLDVNEPALFLDSFTIAYKQLESFGRFIVVHCEDFPVDNYMSEGFEQYKHKAAEKEKELFDIVFNKLVYNGETKINYILMDLPLEHTEDYLKIYELLLYLIDLCDSRAEQFYTSAMEEELLRYFYRKMTVLIEKLVIKDSEDIGTIRCLTSMYLLTKRYFKERTQSLGDFCGKLEAGAREVFNRKIAQTIRTAKEMISDIYFLKRHCHDKLLDFIKRSVREGESLKDKNYRTYALQIFTSVYDNLYKQILTIVYSTSQKENLHICIDDFIGCAVGTGLTEVIKRFYHLKEICDLITVSIDQFITMYDELKGSIEDVELTKLIKCRKDREKVKELLRKQY